jgi:anti-sigma regulatory factor (Ser/Thr protein kinase)
VSTRREFPAVARSVSAARRFVQETAAAEQIEVSLDVVALLTSELATNAVVFGQSDVFAVEVGTRLRAAGGIRVEVVDKNPSPPALREPADDEAHGRGLILVNSLASDWGSYDLPGPRKVVWFEL